MLDNSELSESYLHVCKKKKKTISFAGYFEYFTEKLFLLIFLHTNRTKIRQIFTMSIVIPAEFTAKGTRAIMVH